MNDSFCFKFQMLEYRFKISSVYEEETKRDSFAAKLTDNAPPLLEPLIDIVTDTLFPFLFECRR